MRHLSTPLELLGLLLVLGVAFDVDWRLGAVLVGVLLVVAGYSLDRPRAPREVDG